MNIGRHSLPSLLEVAGRARVLGDAVEADRFLSYDYYDWWATPLGGRMKQLAYRTEPLGNLLFAAPLLALEWWAPKSRSLLRIAKRVYPITVAQHGLTCLELARTMGDSTLIEHAIEDARLLLTLVVPSDVGLSWGFPYAWSTNQGVIPPDQPAATQTSYGFDLLDGLWQLTQDQKYLDSLAGVARSMDLEYPDMARQSGVASTYHGRGQGDVVMNAIGYRVHMLARASELGAEGAREKAELLLAYLLSEQQPDGSWWYGETSKNRFIDHFHTCFMIKNLWRANRVLGSSDLQVAVEAAIAYYWEHLFDDSGLPRPFAHSVRLNPVRYESYDFAECIGLFALLGPDHGFSADRLAPVLDFHLREFMPVDGSARFRVYRMPTARTFPYYRWGVTAGMLALSQLTNSPLLSPEASFESSA